MDIVYIGTPHAFHKQACLDAIAHGKHVLCEKPFTLNRREATEVFDAARKQGVFIMEGKLWSFKIWTSLTENSSLDAIYTFVSKASEGRPRGAAYWRSPSGVLRLWSTI